MARLVLVTRPLEQATEFAGMLSANGFTPLIHPLLQIDYFPVSLHDKPDAILISSLQALKYQSIPDGWADIPVFCVGEKTAQAARVSGFKNILCGAGTLSDVLPYLKEKTKPDSKLLYLRGEHITQDIVSVLPDRQITEVITYRANAIADFDEMVKNRVSEIEVITLFSARTALILKDIFEKNGLLPVAPMIKLLCLSPSVVESVQDMDWKSCHVADAPTQLSMIEKLKSI